MKELSHRFSKGVENSEARRIQKQDAKGRLLVGLGIGEMLASIPLGFKLESSPLVVFAIALFAIGAMTLANGIRMIPQENNPPLRLVK